MKGRIEPGTKMIRLVNCQDPGSDSSEPCLTRLLAFPSVSTKCPVQWQVQVDEIPCLREQKHMLILALCSSQAIRRGLGACTTDSCCYVVSPCLSSLSLHLQTLCRCSWATIWQISWREMESGCYLSDAVRDAKGRLTFVYNCSGDFSRLWPIKPPDHFAGQRKRTWCSRERQEPALRQLRQRIPYCCPLQVCCVSCLSWRLGSFAHIIVTYLFN
jgi:hypothetical protein